MTDAAPSALDVLRRGPLAMLLQVAGADAHVDRNEWAALMDAVAAASDSADELVREVMTAAAEDLRTTGMSPNHGNAPLDALREIGSLLGTVPGGESLREALLEIGAIVAEASGAQLIRTFAAHHGEQQWTKSAGTSAVEREALSAARKALGSA